MTSCAVGCQTFWCYHPKTYKMSHVARNPVYGVQTMSDTNQTEERTGLVVRVSDSGLGDPGSILGRVGVLFP